MILHPYLIFNGEAEEALHFYAEALSLTFEAPKRYEDSPMPHKEHQKKMIVHAELLHEGKTFAMLADSLEENVKSGGRVQLSINFENEKSFQRFFENLSKGGTITMPLEKQFWNATFGMCTDKFGVHWMVNYQHP